MAKTFFYVPSIPGFRSRGRGHRIDQVAHEADPSGMDQMKRPILTFTLMLALAALLLPASLALAGPLTYPEAIKDAEARARNKDYNGSVLAYQEALKIATTPDQKSSVYYYIGHTYRMAGDLPKTIEFMTRSFETTDASDSRKAMAAIYIGDTYWGDRKVEPAREWYAKVKGLPGASAFSKSKACYNTGRTYNTRETAPQARAAYAEILTIAGVTSDDKSDAHNSMALVSFSIKDLAQAKIDLENSINFEGLSEPRNQRGLVGLAGIAKSTGKFEDAAKAYEDLLAYKPLIESYRPQIQYQLADVYVSLKNTDKAKLYFEAAMANPGSSADLKKSSQMQLDKLAGKTAAPAPAPAKTPAKAPAPASTQPAK
jgi:tetratricopeptide (TPR) repeat protein